MTRAVLFHPDARQDVLSAAAWYERQQPGRGAMFVAYLHRLIRRMQHFPSAHPVMHGDYRRAVLTVFPYTVVFRIRGDELLVVAVFHQHRNPDAVTERLR